MEDIPLEWIDRIFELMQEFFGDRWLESFRYPHHVSLYKMQWQTGLMGLTKDDIKKALSVSKRLAKNNKLPPNVIDFYHYAKGIKIPTRELKKDTFFPNPELAKSFIETIKTKIKKDVA